MVTTTWSQTAGMTSETGTDNIEDYAEQAEASKNAAAASETAAASSASAASTSASSASTDAASALSSKNAAATSETNAATSEANAASSSVTASTAATNASTSASNSASSATASANSASAAATSETNAATSETNAAASETAAAGSATSASTSETNAATSETNAAASETAAATSETNAATSETNAATSETNAATSETNAATSETNAASSATAAASSASAASTSATSASNAQTAAESARDATLTAYDNFDDRYLGAKSSAPTVDNDGNALVAGSLYFDTVSGAMRVYTGSAWVAAYVNGADYLALSGGTMTGNVSYGDNVKATFGASADLQIYHDGSNSYINDAGTGELRIQANGALDINKYTGENMARFFADGAVELYHNNSIKLDTTSTGINVTGKIIADEELVIESASGYGNIEIGGPSGAFIDLKSPFSNDYDGRIITSGSGLQIITSGDNPVEIQHNNVTKISTSSTGINVAGTVVADGLTVDGSANVKSSGGKSTISIGDTAANTYAQLLLYGGATKYNWMAAAQYNTNNAFEITPSTAAEGVIFSNPAFRVDSNRDISFYEDTGTTAKFYWDASNESLGIGTSSPDSLYAGANNLVVGGGIGNTGTTVYSGTSGVGSLYFADGTSGADAYRGWVEYRHDTDYLNFGTAATERMRIDSSGNLEMTGGGSVGWANFTFKEESGYLYVYNGSTKIMRVDASGNAAFAGDVEANATL